MAESFQDVYASWSDDPNLTPFDEEVLREVAVTGEVTRTQYVAAIYRLTTCMDEAGYPSSLRNYPSGMIEIQPGGPIYEVDQYLEAKQQCERSTSISAIMGYNLQQGNPKLLSDPVAVVWDCLYTRRLVPPEATPDDVHRFLTRNETTGLPYNLADLAVRECFFGAGATYSLPNAP